MLIYISGKCWLFFELTLPVHEKCALYAQKNAERLAIINFSAISHQKFIRLWVAWWLEHRTPDRRKPWVRCPMPPKILRVHTEYVLVKSVGPKVLWADHECRGQENISLPSSPMAKLWKWR
ncbi:hypothetical protein TNCV_2338041 [Trichonephila clavipes]|nr:hypothetical protein TNCV_2338041 [Trichonephila clavipes]